MLGESRGAYAVRLPSARGAGQAFVGGGEVMKVFRSLKGCKATAQGKRSAALG